ncbi:MAG TPA: hypothetical protein VFP43_12980 [Mesorhizobium sp.]|nr:hypothetical protein [Mesorhizobium sp.]
MAVGDWSDLHWLANQSPRNLHHSERSLFAAAATNPIRIALSAVIVACGGPSSAALRASAVEGKSFGYKVAIAEDTLGDVYTFLHKVALFEIAHKYADVLSLEELISQL